MKRSQDESLNTLLSSVRDKMGRCILRLQQYELLMKALVANHELSVYVDGTSEALREADVRGMTLGRLVGELTGSYLTSATAGSQDETADEFRQPDPRRAHIQARFQQEMTEEDYETTKEGLRRLVELRNNLVHHFMEQFNLSNSSGCRSAEIYLDDAYQEIDQQFRALRDWAEHMDHARKEIAKFMSTPEYRHWFMYGVFPGEEVDWPGTTIVQQLLVAERDCHEGGWTNLTKATESIRERWPELTPKKYGCSRWRHVLHESGLFEIQKRRGSNSGAVQVWYRSKVPAT